MPVRTKRLAGPTAVTTTNVTLYTVPTGKTAIVKQLSFWLSSGTTPTVRFFINGTAAGNHVFDVISTATGTPQQTGQFIVLEPGDTFRAETSTGTVNITVHGSELDGVAP